jgi:hypothetical protein
MMPTEKMKPKKVIIIGSIATVLILLFYLYVLFNGLAFQQHSTTTPQANLTRIAPQSIPTLDSSLLVLTPTIKATTVTENPGAISINSYVKIFGTGGSGLKIRFEPGTDTKVNFIANESEVFLVIGGPVTKNDLVWWNLSAPYDTSRSGWAAAEYLVYLEQ